MNKFDKPLKLTSTVERMDSSPVIVSEDTLNYAGTLTMYFTLLTGTLFLILGGIISIIISSPITKAMIETMKTMDDKDGKAIKNFVEASISLNFSGIIWLLISFAIIIGGILIYTVVKKNKVNRKLKPSNHDQATLPEKMQL